MSAANGVWREPRPLVLASKSSGRAALLKQTGIPFLVEVASIDERAVESPLRDAGADASAIATHLARAKAEAVSHLRPDHLIVGADQTLALGSRMFNKPADRDEALAQLRALSGREHTLHSALCVMRGNDVLFETTQPALMSVRALSEPFLAAYADAAGAALTSSVGAYQVEGFGIHLFERIAGDHSTILGLPLIPLLAFFRRNGSVLG
jgi:septum formation protein